jgi:peroxiredoxin
VRSLFIIVAGIVVVVALYGLYAATGMQPGGPGGPAMLAGAPAQSFPAQRLGGGEDALANYRGRVVLVNLWASWCTPCREEMPDLQRLYMQESQHGLVVLGVDQGESAETARAFVQAHGVTFPILLDQEQRYGRAYAAIGLPTSIVVGRDGRIVKGVDGALTLAQMHAAVDSLLATARGT